MPLADSIMKSGIVRNPTIVFSSTGGTARIVRAVTRNARPHNGDQKNQYSEGRHDSQHLKRCCKESLTLLKLCGKTTARDSDQRCDEQRKKADSDMRGDLLRKLLRMGGDILRNFLNHKCSYT